MRQRTKPAPVPSQTVELNIGTVERVSYALGATVAIATA
jgi:hypothetical protein